MMTSVPVALGERAYRIHIGAGLLGRAGEFIRPFVAGSALDRPLPVVTDETVAGLHVRTRLPARN